MTRPTPAHAKTGEPDINALWDTYRAMREVEPLLRYSQRPVWRLARSDWLHLLRVDMGAVPVALETYDSQAKAVRRTLFSLEADVIDDHDMRAPAFPEIALVCDRRQFSD